MSRIRIVINTEGGLVQDVFCADPDAEVIVVDWDADEVDLGSPDVVEVQSGSRVYHASVMSPAACPLDDLTDSDVGRAIEAARRQGLLSRSTR